MKTYNCICCEYSTSRKTNMDKHLSSEKHISNSVNVNTEICVEIKKNKLDNFNNNDYEIEKTHKNFTKIDNTLFSCNICKKTYKSYSGIWKHSSNCKNDASNDDVSVDNSYSKSCNNDTKYDNNGDLDDDVDDYDDDPPYYNNTYNETDNYKVEDDDFFTKTPTDESSNINNKDQPKDTAEIDASTPTMSMIMKLAEMFLEHQQKMSTTQIETQKQMNEKQFESQMQVNEQIVTAITELKNTAIEIKNASQCNITNNNTTNTNSNNNLTQNNIQNINDIKFNMNMYLHEYCKNAINITEFFNKIISNVDASVYELLGRKGYVQGITEIILEELKKYKDYERPVHCVDYRRETMVIKHNNEWNKDYCKVPGNIATSVIGKGIYAISERNKYNVTQKDLQEQAKYGVASCKEKDIEILRHAIGHYKIKNIERVISNIAKNTTIDKEGYIRQLKDKLTKQLNDISEIENID